MSVTQEEKEHSEVEDKSLEFRRYFSHRYLIGKGIEIGDLRNPLEVPETIRVEYINWMKTTDLQEGYPQLGSENVVEVDRGDPGEVLITIPDNSQDFVVINHVFENCQDPITSLHHMLRILNPGGVLYLAISDQNFSVDVARPVTSFAHILRDYKEGSELSRREHFEEWVKSVKKVKDSGEIEKIVDEMIKNNCSIHFHVWRSLEFLDFLLSVKQIIKFSWKLETCFENGLEFITILRKE